MLKTDAFYFKTAILIAGREKSPGRELPTFDCHEDLSKTVHTPPNKAKHQKSPEPQKDAGLKCIVKHMKG